MDPMPVATPDPPRPDPGPYRPLSYADLHTTGPAQSPWLWRGYLAPGLVTLLTSQWKLGKSTLLAVLLARLKAGGELAGFPLRPGKAVVVSEESPALWYQRGRSLAFGEHVCWFCRPFRGKPRPDEWLALIEQVGRIHDAHAADLVVFDSLANLSPARSENDAAEVLKTLLPLQRLTGRGLAVLLLHHPRKGPVLPGQAARGSGALTGYVDICLEMHRVTRRNLNDRRRRLLAFSRHECTPPCWVIELTADGTDYRALGESAELTFADGWPLVQSLLAAADGPRTRKELLRDWSDPYRHPPGQVLWKWLDQAVRQGAVERDGHGTRRDPYRYSLPGMVEKWQAQFVEEFNRRPDSGAAYAPPAR
jgi:hypothetical protein